MEQGVQIIRGISSRKKLRLLQDSFCRLHKVGDIVEFWQRDLKDNRACVDGDWMSCEDRTAGIELDLRGGTHLLA